MRDWYAVELFAEVSSEPAADLLSQVHGMNVDKPSVGAFAQYVGAYHDLLLKIPESMSFEDAASFGTGVSTASLSLFHEMCVPATLEQLSAGVENNAGEFVLVAGGSTATGTRAIQLLKL